MRGLIKFAWVPVLAVSAMAAPFSVSTGTANWQVRQNVGAAANTNLGFDVTTTALVLTGQIPANAFGNPWVAAPSGSAWVGQSATDGNVNGFGCTQGAQNCGAVAGTYVYTLTFAGGLGGTLNFGFASDNFMSSVTVTQGATTIYNFTNAGGASNQASLTNTGLLNYGAGGTVTITATVVNSGLTQVVTDRNPSGFLVSGTGNSIDNPGNVIPEPSTYAMLGLGLTALAAARMRRK